MEELYYDEEYFCREDNTLKVIVNGDYKYQYWIFFPGEDATGYFRKDFNATVEEIDEEDGSASGAIGESEYVGTYKEALEWCLKDYEERSKK